MRGIETDIDRCLHLLQARCLDDGWVWPEHKLFFRFWPAQTFSLEDVLASKRRFPDLLVLHCWVDVWYWHKQVVLSKLASLLGQSRRVYARQTRFERSTAAALDDFMRKHHIHPNPAVRHNFALVNKELPVAMASFSRGKKMFKNGTQVKSFEMVRFATESGYNVVGGLSKLIRGFARLYQPDDLVCYADLDWSDGRGYRALGFKALEIKPPQFFWLDPVQMRRYYPDQIQNPHGYIKIWNTGSQKFELDFSSQDLKI